MQPLGLMSLPVLVGIILTLTQFLSKIITYCYKGMCEKKLWTGLGVSKPY